MSLALYRRKRDFRRTPEPRGGRVRRAATGLKYFIQKHAARRLHYDFRLELDGVLKSWAVPKGPCLDPHERRLAVHVEDHPLDYGPFEGEIPKGEYGGGSVLLWDRGEWTPEGDPRQAYEKGRMKFRLEGRKLSGSWELVLMGGRAGEGRKNWLLIKLDDEAARPLSEEDVLERAESVSGPEPAPGRDELPARVELELATLSSAVPPGGDWVHEIKLDGYRILSRVEGGRIRLESRRGNDWTERFESVAAALKNLGARDALLDGEVVVLDDEGRSSFSALQNAISEGRDDLLVYFIFDLLFLNGRDLRGRPLLERKDALKKLLDRSNELGGKDFFDRVRYSDHVDGQGEELFRRVCGLELEGVVSKRKDAAYSGGRSQRWLKVKCLNEQEFVIAGFTEPGGSRENFGALVLGARQGRGLQYAGRVGTGFNAASLRRLHGMLKELETPKPAFARLPPAADARGVHWVRPELVAEVAFHGWTRDGILRQPSFKGLREDKPAADVVIEKPVPPPVRLTHPDRVMYPDSGITKKDLIEYYEAVAERMLPHVAGRPLALVRCPDGLSGHCFYQKHESDAFPKEVRSVLIREKDGVERRNMFIEDGRGLAALVQAGVLEIHPWGCRVEDVERPDSMIFDLDPDPGTPWKTVVAAAREVRTRLSAAGLESFLKTTGGKGLHVVAPLKPGPEWPAVKEWARSFAALMARESPELYTTRLAKAARGGRLFIDYLRNERGSTAVGAYSTRRRPGAPVSAPVSWDELKPSLRPDKYTLKNMRRRLSAPDPWRRFEQSRRVLPPGV